METNIEEQDFKLSDEALDNIEPNFMEIFKTSMTKYEILDLNMIISNTTIQTGKELENEAKEIA